MTFLQLVQAFVRDADTGAGGPLTVIGQTSELGQAVEFIREAWLELQSRHEWRWMRRSYAIELINEQEIYTIDDARDVGYMDNSQLANLDPSTKSKNFH